MEPLVPVFTTRVSSSWRKYKRKKILYSSVIIGGPLIFYFTRGYRENSSCLSCFHFPKLAEKGEGGGRPNREWGSAHLCLRATVLTIASLPHNSTSSFFLRGSPAHRWEFSLERGEGIFPPFFSPNAGNMIYLPLPEPVSS